MEDRGKVRADGTALPRPDRSVADVVPRTSYAGLRTYPAPRTVWIIGERPTSIFLRRYEM